jgi:hypothetical protein
MSDMTDTGNFGDTDSSGLGRSGKLCGAYVRAATQEISRSAERGLTVGLDASQVTISVKSTTSKPGGSSHRLENGLQC